MQTTLKVENFAGRNFRDFANFLVVRESLYPRNGSFHVVCESLYPQNFLTFLKVKTLENGLPTAISQVQTLAKD